MPTSEWTLRYTGSVEWRVSRVGSEVLRPWPADENPRIPIGQAPVARLA
jgi:hypothetical protein